MSLLHWPSKWPKGERPSGKGRLLTVDTETIGLLRQMSHGYYKGDQQDMHLIVATDVLTEEQFVFFDPYEKRRNEKELLKAEGTQDGYLQDGVKFLLESEAMSFHNVSGFDGIALELCFPDLWRPNYFEVRGKGALRQDLMPNKFMDTLVMSRLLNPDRKLPGAAYAMGANCGPHTIEAHGIRIGVYKPENEDWTKLTDHMIHRCCEDTVIGRDYLLWLLTNEWSEHLKRGPNPRTGLGILTAYRQELKTAFDMARQEYRGWRLDVPEAVKLSDVLNKEVDATEKAFRKHMPLRLKTKPLSSSGIAKEVSNAWSKYGVHLNTWSFKAERRSDLATKWELSTKAGVWCKPITAMYPECRGHVADTPELERTVVGPFSPVRWEDIPLGNRDTVKQVLYKEGWLGVEYNDTEQDYIDEHGELPNPWAGKINEKSLDSWRERMQKEGRTIPGWAEGIAAWYILSSRRNQVLNRGDVLKYEMTGEVPKQTGGKRAIRGLLPMAWNHQLCMTAEDYFVKHGCWPTSGKTDPEPHDDTWCVPAAAFSIGTNTFRMRHKGVVNIPSRGLYPLRYLFIARKGKMILGCDGAGLELRMLAHFMGSLEYIDVVLNGDIHSHNQEKAGLPLRDMAKTFIYAFLYGSGIPNLAAVCGMSEKEMRKVVERFKAELPELSALIEGIERAGRTHGYMLSVDGRWGRIRTKGGEQLVHTILNVLLQMTGSLCMKYSQVIAGDWMLKEGVGLDEFGFCAWLANVHDEIQQEIPEGEVEERTYQIPASDWKAEEKREYYDDSNRMWSAPVKVDSDEETVTVMRRYHRCGELLARAMVRAGEYLKIRLPLAGEYKIGHSWAETH